MKRKYSSKTSWHAHDTAYKELFGQKRVFIDLLKCVFGESEISKINLSTLQREPTEQKLEKPERLFLMILSGAQKTKAVNS